MLRVGSLPGSLMRVLEPFRPRFTAPDLEPFVVLAAAPGEPTPREIRAIQALRLAHVGYRNRDNPLIRQQLPHRDEHELAAAADRLGWASWEDRNAVARVTAVGVNRPGVSGVSGLAGAVHCGQIGMLRRSVRPIAQRGSPCTG